ANWRTRSNRVWSRADVRLRSRDEERGFRKTHSRFSQKVFSSGQKLPAQLRAFGGRFSFALSRRSRRDAAGASAKRILQLVEGIHAADSGRQRRQRERGLVAGRDFTGPERSEAGASGRIEPEPGVDVGRN